MIHVGQRLFLLLKMLYCVIIVCITVLLDPYGCKMQLNKYIPIIYDCSQFEKDLYTCIRKQRKKITVQRLIY
jgi:hypothetical protein